MTNPHESPLTTSRHPAPTRHVASLARQLTCASICLAVAPSWADELRALTEPVSAVEVGGIGMNGATAKSAEFNGLTDDRIYGVLNFSLFGGQAGVRSESAFRWKLVGKDLTTDTYKLGGEIGIQGINRLTASYGQLVRNQYDDFRAIHRGVGGTHLSLPANYPGASSRLNGTATPSDRLANWGNIQSPYASASCADAGDSTGACAGPATVIPAAAQITSIGTRRRQAAVAYSHHISDNTEVRGSFKHEKKTGIKLTGTTFGGFIGTLLPEPVDSTHDQFDASVHYHRKAGQLKVGYYGSIYRNKVSNWSAENPFYDQAVLGNVAHMNGAPGNQMHQLSAAGMLRLDKYTQVNLAATYGRRTQDASFLNYVGNGGSYQIDPARTSLGGRVVTNTVDLRITDRGFEDVTLVLAYRYDEKKNKTAPLIAEFDTPPQSAGGSRVQRTSQAPSRIEQRISLDADIQVSEQRALRAGIDVEQVKRRCESSQSAPCLFDVGRTDEHGVRAEWRETYSDSIEGRFSYRFARVEPIHDASPTGQIAGSRRDFLAASDRQTLRSQVNKQITEAFALTGAVDFNLTDYTTTRYGTKDRQSVAYHLEANHISEDDLKLTAYLAHENLRTTIAGNASAPPGTGTPSGGVGTCTDIIGSTDSGSTAAAGDPCRDWSTTLKDRINTLGVSLKKSNVIGSKVNVSGDLSYSHAMSPIAVSGGSWFSDGTSLRYLSAQDFPDVKARIIDARIAATYPLDRTSALRADYRYLKLKTTDWQWDAYVDTPMGLVATQQYIGPGVRSPDYRTQAFAVTYVHHFQ